MVEMRKREKMFLTFVLQHQTSNTVVAYPTYNLKKPRKDRGLVSFNFTVSLNKFSWACIRFYIFKFWKVGSLFIPAWARQTANDTKYIMVINRQKDLCQHALKIKNLEKRYYQKIDIAIEPNTDNTQMTALSHKKDI